MIAVAGDAQLDALVRRYELAGRARGQLRALLELLVDDPLAPTSIRDPRRALEDHVADSLVALDLPEVRASSLIADLGAGAGLPGLPLAIALPEATVALVESSARKCAFLKRAVNASDVSNAYVVHTRVEEWDQQLGMMDLVTARALGPLPVIVEYAAPLLRVGGALVAWRGRRDSADEAAGRLAADELGMEAGEPVAVNPYPAAEHRHLHLMLKVKPTPAGYPRRVGMARKRPLAVRATDRTSSDRAHR